ncbi:Pyruvate decarboxylase [Salix suchowensis]|nr:Pyruvate decarboxylase [Salix suchowensis]
MASQTVVALQDEVNRLKIQLQSLAEQDSSQKIRVGDYLLARLEQLGANDLVEDHPSIGALILIISHFHGLILISSRMDRELVSIPVWKHLPLTDHDANSNELNAAYAADGYARVKSNSIGVILTTFGVGELSAMNGIAGGEYSHFISYRSESECFASFLAFSEMVPVLHIVGVPSTVQQKSKPMLHHTLGDGRFDAYEKAAEQFTISQAILKDPNTAAAEIDRVLTDCITSVCLSSFLPEAAAQPLPLRPAQCISPSLLISCIPKYHLPSSGSPCPAPSPNDQDVEKFVLDEIVKLVETVDNDAIFLVDACAIRHDVRDELDEMIRKTGFPVYSAPMGKTAVSEQYERYGGIYVGSISHPEIKEKVESAKLIISIGSLKTDFNTGNFTYSIPTDNIIEVNSHLASFHLDQGSICGLRQCWHEGTHPETFCAITPIPGRRTSIRCAKICSRRTEGTQRRHLPSMVLAYHEYVLPAARRYRRRDRDIELRDIGCPIAREVDIRQSDFVGEHRMECR